MLKRLLKIAKKQNIFLFGARGTGKSTLLKEEFDQDDCLWLDLLNPELESRLSRHPEELKEIVTASPHLHYVVIDEIQKIPKLLDVIHHLIENTPINFIMTGSSARKLKYGGANLLAGRAFVYHLYPFSYLELGEQFNLDRNLQWGMLPKVQWLKTDEDKFKFLQAYTYTYLKEEIWAEHFIRKLDPFRRFLEVSAQCNGKIINYANLANDVGVDDKTIKEYFSILEDSLIGFFLEPFQHSFRKRLSAKPKFYFFDTGVTRSLSRTLSIPFKESTSVFGEAFEHFIILECVKLASYYKTEFRFSYLKTKDDAKVDLVVERPGEKLLFIEIKSAKEITQSRLSSFIKITKDFGECEAVCFSRDSYKKHIENVIVYPWQEGIKKYFC